MAGEMCEIIPDKKPGILKRFWQSLKTKRLEPKNPINKEIIVAAQQQAHFITNKKLSKAMPMGRVGLDEKLAEATYEEQQAQFMNSVDARDYVAKHKRKTFIKDKNNKSSKVAEQQTEQEAEY